MKKRIATLKLLPALLLLPIFAAGCDKAENPVAPSGSTINMSANPARIGPNGESTLTITGFRPDGNRLNPGTQVRLSATLGNLSSSIVEIGSDGFTTAILRGDGRTGDSTVSAKLTTDTTESTVTVNIGAAKPSLLIVAERNEIDPSEPIFVTFFARDENALPMGAGEVIQVAATLGTLFVNNQEVTSLTTDSSGRAVARFVAGQQAGTAKITAFLGSSDVATSDITIRDSATDFTLTVDTTEVSRGGKVVMTVVAKNQRGLPARGVFVQFLAARGPGGTGGSVIGTFVPAATTTTADGIATSTFTFSDETIPITGSFYLRARVTLRIGGNSIESEKEEKITVR